MKRSGSCRVAAVAARRRRLHLRVEPVGQRREAAEQQHRRPRGSAVEQRRRADHRASDPLKRRVCGATRGSEPSLRREDQLGELAHRAGAAFAARHVVRVLAHRCGRVRNGRRRTRRRASTGTSGRSSPTCAQASGGDAELGAQRFPRARACRAAPSITCVTPRRARAMQHRRRVAAGDPRDDDAGAPQQLDARRRRARENALISRPSSST